MLDISKMTKKQIQEHYERELEIAGDKRTDLYSKLSFTEDKLRDARGDIKSLTKYKLVTESAQVLVAAQIHLGTELEAIEGNPYQEMRETFREDVKFLKYLHDQLQPRSEITNASHFGL